MLQTENLTPLQNLTVVSRSPDIIEAIVLSRIIGPSLGQLQSQQLGEEAMTRQTSLPLFLSQSLAICEALELGAGRVVRLTATICIEIQGSRGIMKSGSTGRLQRQHLLLRVRRRI